MSKREYLVVYDYGMGGLWGIILARDEEEILRLFPELTIVHEKPDWMTHERLDAIRSHEVHDIDGAPWGMLNALLDDRAKQQNDISEHNRSRDFVAPDRDIDHRGR